MAIRDLDSESEAEQTVTPMSEIRRHQGIPFEEFCQRYPDWEWSERRKREWLMWDEDGRCWVPMIEPVHGLPYGFDEPGFTPAVEEALIELSQRAIERVRAGGGVDFAELDADESYWHDE